MQAIGNQMMKRVLLATAVTLVAVFLIYWLTS